MTVSKSILVVSILTGSDLTHPALRALLQGWKVAL